MKRRDCCWYILIVTISLLMLSCTINRESNVTPSPVATSTPVAKVDRALRTESVAKDVGLVIALQFAPDGRLFFAEKQGGVFSKVVDAEEGAPMQQILQLDVAKGNENGLLGLALAPDFATTGHFYVYYNVPNDDGAPIMSRIVRYREEDNRATEETIIVDKLPTSPEQQYHFGGGLSFGPDGKLYLIFGDRNMLAMARDPEQLPGSILRFNPDGSIPNDNPFPNSAVYAYGIRNGFGLTWHPQTGYLYETENGTTCDDELNLILPGADYGWGVHAYDACPYPDDTGEAPLYQWTPVVAPAGLMFYTGDLLPEFKGDLLVCAFNQSQLYHFKLSENGRSVRDVSLINIPTKTNLCRVALTQGPDGWIYASISDHILRIGR
jgi:glucose/arabinose dehydrogenase